MLAYADGPVFHPNAAKNKSAEKFSQGNPLDISASLSDMPKIAN
jgi:hypothetical protein